MAPRTGVTETRRRLLRELAEDSISDNLSNAEIKKRRAEIYRHHPVSKRVAAKRVAGQPNNRARFFKAVAALRRLKLPQRTHDSEYAKLVRRYGNHQKAVPKPRAAKAGGVAKAARGPTQKSIDAARRKALEALEFQREAATVGYYKKTRKAIYREHPTSKGRKRAARVPAPRKSRAANRPPEGVCKQIKQDAFNAAMEKAYWKVMEQKRWTKGKCAGTTDSLDVKRSWTD